MVASTPAAAARQTSPPALPAQVLLVAGVMLVGLIAVSGAYGFHGDEMYYVVAGQHPSLGYVDQPPLTPLLSALSVALLGVTPTAVRILPAVEMALVVIIVALIARDLGGSAPRPDPRRDHGRSLRLPRRRSSRHDKRA